MTVEGEVAVCTPGPDRRYVRYRCRKPATCSFGSPTKRDVKSSVLGACAVTAWTRPGRDHPAHITSGGTLMRVATYTASDEQPPSCA
jgi:hypothetical protein